MQVSSEEVCGMIGDEMASVRQAAAADGSGARDLAIPAGHDSRAAKGSGHGATSVWSLARRLSGAAGVEGSSGHGAAIVGAGGHHRLGAKSAVPSPRTDGATRPHPARRLPTDSRGARVSLTESGAAAFRRASAPHLRAIKTHFVNALTPEQLEALADILQSLQRHLHAEVSADSAGGAHH